MADGVEMVGRCTKDGEADYGNIPGEKAPPKEKEANLNSIANAVKKLEKLMSETLLNVKENACRLHELQTLVAQMKGVSPTPTLGQNVQHEGPEAVQMGIHATRSDTVHCTPTSKSPQSKRKSKSSALADDNINIRLVDLDNENKEDNQTETTIGNEGSQQSTIQTVVNTRSAMQWNERMGTMMSIRNMTVVNPRFVKRFRATSSVEQTMGGPYKVAETSNLARNLFSSPYASKLTSVPREDILRQRLTPNVSRRDRTRSKSKRSKINLPTGEVLLGVMKSNFAPTEDMMLISSQVQLSLYVFGRDLDPEEPLLRMGKVVVTRGELQCLCPDKIIDDQIVTLMSMMTTWRQSHAERKVVWCLPPTFADDVFTGHTLEDLIDNYAATWMPPYSTLKYVYVPMKNEFAHWFLMVMSIEEKISYLLDSNLRQRDLEGRIGYLQTLGEVIAQIIATNIYPTGFLNGATQFSSWTVKEARGIPNTGRSSDSIIWLLDWMLMEAGFQPNLRGLVDEEHVRMTIAMALVGGRHNDLYTSIGDKAQIYWDTFFV
ncbi:Ulp1 protease family, C-terminal catalytic domain [Sesbania bispinosa]|nr:Ulp1 protease family, C-terminal catalytic domain [Sesbania bispinosa]